MGKIVPTKKVYLEEAIAELGLTGMPVIRALKSLLMYSQDDDLPIYFESEITGVNIDAKFEEVRDTAGDINGIQIVDGHCETLRGLKTVVSATVSASSNGTEFFIGVFSFKNKDHKYYASDETEIWVEPKLLDGNALYLDRDELLNFIELMDRENRKKLYKDGSIPSKQKATPIHLQREIAFKSWLATKAGEKIHDDSSYQTCYKAIGSPTRDKVWEMLQAVDRTLFAAGRDDFFALQKIIKFQSGTGQGRNQ